MIDFKHLVFMYVRLCLLLGMLASAPLLAQPVVSQPDCRLPFNFAVGVSLPANTTAFDNRVAGCTTWQVVYNSYTFSALSLVVQTAPNVSAGVPGSWSTFTAVTGSNPNTNTTSGVATFGGPTSYFPWLRVQLTSGTLAGTISGQLYGWRIPATSAAVIVGTVDTNLVEVGGAAISEGQKTMANSIPVVVASDQSAIPIVGNKTNNAAVPGATNVGVLPALANAAVPTWTEGDLVVESVDLQGNQRVTVAGNTVVLSGQQSVTGSAVALATNTTKAACVKALVSNLINVFVGPSGITTSTGYLLAPGESVCLPATNTNLLFVIASTTGASVSWLASR